MHTFEITVQRKSGDAWPVVVEQSTSGVFLPLRDEGTLQLDLTELASQTTPKEYGLVLGRALFRDEVRDAFVQALTQSEDYLRVLLFVEADDLKTLRWERLCAPLDRGWDFLALTQRAPFCLYLPSLTDRRFPPIGRRDLRALVLVASPDGLERYRLQPFDVETAVSSVRAALGAIPCEVLAGIEGAAGPPTLDALCERITAEHYTLLHIVCHGQFLRESGETVLYWDTADQHVDPVAGTRFLERLSRLQGAKGLPHSAFLGTCESARPEAEGALGGLAQRLVRELGMPAVVAMTETVSVTTAQALGTAFYGRLREHGEVDRALVEACAGLAERYDVMVPALYSRLGGRPLFSDTREGPLTNAEIGFGLDRLRTLLAERAPTQQEIFQTQEVNLRGTLGAEVAALSVVAGQEREQALAEVNKLCGEALDLSFGALALGQEPPAYDDRCPFRGLYPFRVEDREFFFGREALVEQLRQKLADHSFLAVLGPSGSGKSSVVLAGLIPALQAKEPGLQMGYLTPGGDPVAQLDASLGQRQDGHAVLVADQFEELFTLCTNEAIRQAFLDRLLMLAEKQRVVLTMRADFWGECAPYRHLKDRMQAHQELIAPMDAAELRRAMERQAGKVGLRFEADLSHTILDDVQGEPGAMPLLQHALLELWKRRHGRWLRAEEYRAIGGVQQAIASTADAVYEKLSTDRQERVRDIFVRLTRLDDEVGLGGERRDTRRRVELAELVPVESNPMDARALVKQLADARLIVTSVNAATNRDEVEVAHEALIRVWSRLRGWLEEDRGALQLRDRVSREALEWEQHRADESYLMHRGRRLQEAGILLTHSRISLNERERAYLTACQESDLQQRVWLFDADVQVRFPKIDIRLSQPGGEANSSMRQGDHSARMRFEVDHLALRELEGNGAAYGQLLSQSLFIDPAVQTAFAEARSTAQTQEAPLHLRCWINSNAPELHTLAWETLRDPRQDAPLLTSRELLFSRALSSQEVRPRSRRDLRALVVIANPDSGASTQSNEPFEVTEELRRIQTVLGPIPATALIAGDETPLNTLSARLSDGYDILYLVCPVSLSKGEVWLWQDKGSGVPGRDLLARLREAPKRPRLIVIESQQHTGGIDSPTKNDRDALAALGPQFAQVGIPAVVTLPADMTRQTLEQMLTAIFSELQRDGQIDRAIAVARSIAQSRPDWWLPVLYTCVENSALWYAPGFGKEQRGLAQWPVLLSNLRQGRITPILGPGLSESLLGPRREIAQRWAEIYNVPVASQRRVDFPQVAQYMAVNEGPLYLRDKLMQYLREEMLRRYANDLPEELHQASLDELVTAVGAQHRARDPMEPHQLLAGLPLPIYITTDASNLLIEALTAAGKKPQVELCRWNEDLADLPSIYDTEPNYRPDIQRPLVYHLFGRNQEPDSLILTEDDYFDYLIAVTSNKDLIPVVVRRALAQTALLFLGYQIDELDFQILRRSIMSSEGSRRRSRYSHIIQLEPEAAHGQDIDRYREQYVYHADIFVYWGNVEDIAQDIQRHWEGFAP
jgi:hypothetical protein